MAMRNLSATCLQSDMQRQFDVAKKSLADGQMIGKKLLVNGADIAEDLDDAVSSIQEQNFTESGRSVGHAMRCVILQTSKLPPEGAPRTDAVVAMTGGLITGLLGGPTLVASEDGNPTNWRLNFTTCATGAKTGFMHLWMDLWSNFSHLAVEPSQHGALNTTLWRGLMSDFLLHAPSLLQSCGLSLDVIDMLNDGAKAVGKLNLNLTLEEHRIDWKDVHDSLDQAVLMFKDKKWDAFGMHLGRAVQDFVLYLLPHAFGKSPSGVLQRYSTQAAPGTGSCLAVPILLGMLGSVFLAVAFVLRRGMREQDTQAYHACGTADLEGCPLAEEAIE